MAEADSPEDLAAQEARSQRRAARLRRRRGRGLVRRMLRLALLGVGPIAVVTVGGVWYATSGRIVATENAYVKASHVLVTPMVSGMVVEVYARDDEVVARDQPLFRIDPMPFRLDLEKATAELDAVRYEVGSYRAAYRKARAELARARKEAAFLEKEYRRRNTLEGGRALAKVELDRYRHEWQVARERIPELEQQVNLELAHLGGKPDLAVEAHPRFRRLHAERAKAALDLERATVRAPTGGRIANLDLQAGEFVAAGSPVFSLIGNFDTWIEANLKETQLTHVREGQRVAIQVDAYPDYAWSGTVASLSAGTGAEFSLLPAQNATGNWVKVVQRVPVRIDIDPDSAAPELRAGMSTTVEIDTGHERPLPGFARSALALVGYER